MIDSTRNKLLVAVLFSTSFAVGILYNCWVYYYVRPAVEEIPPPHPLQFAINDDPLANNSVAIRSPGKDGEIDDYVYEVRGFRFDEYDQDLVWADGHWARWPTSNR